MMPVEECNDDLGRRVTVKKLGVGKGGSLISSLFQMFYITVSGLALDKMLISEFCTAKQHSVMSRSPDSEYLLNLHILIV